LISDENKGESLEDLENLPSPDILAREITENLESALKQFNGICENLKEEQNQLFNIFILEIKND